VVGDWTPDRGATQNWGDVELTGDLAVWQALARFRPDLFCGLFMGSSNDGVSLSPRALLALGERGIELGLDIYEADEEVRNAQRQQAIS